MLLQFLRTGRGIAFSDMFVMTEYPADMLPLYAQAHSLADYLIQQGGRRKYVSFLAEAMHSGNWVSALETWYAVKDLGTLQANWVAWVGRGSPPLPKAPEVSRGSQLAARPPRPEPNLIHHIAGAAAIPLTAGDAVSTHVARPQPIQRPRQVVVE
jgi:hypothetical protein